MDYVLQTDGLCKRYGHFTALDGLTMRVPKGAIYGFVGRNGAGKTTLIRLICGLQSPPPGATGSTARSTRTGPSAAPGGAWARWWRPPPSTWT